MIKFSKEIMNLAMRRLPCRNSINILCSAGVDSVAATHYCFTKLYRRYGPFLVRHFNHKLRHQNEIMERKYLDLFKSSYKIQGYPPIDLSPYIKNKSEDGLHKARLDYIKNNAEYTIFITAHHLDDATESHMLNVLRGNEEYQPIPFITEVGSNLIVHPFLFTKKADFVKYATRNFLLQYVVEDETNKINKGSRRNFIRNDILPLLKREQIGLDTIVKRKLNERLMLEIIKG